MKVFFLQVAIDVPLFRLFDYLPPEDTTPSPDWIGRRVLVPFGRQKIVGIITAINSESSVEPKKLKRAIELIDAAPLFPAAHLNWLQWVIRYYHYPMGPGLFTALPVQLRTANKAEIKTDTIFRATDRSDTTQLNRSPKQRRLLELLKTRPLGFSGAELNALLHDWRTPMKELEKKNFVVREKRGLQNTNQILPSNKVLNEGQTNAIARIVASLGHFGVFLLEGVTGSGKTEVYLSSLSALLRESDRQALILVPEIGLTPQLIQRFGERFQLPMCVMHSALNDQERANAWLLASSGEARLIIGTRSAVFTPIPRLGLIILDEEHDTSFKQQEGLRYSARDIAIVRAQRESIPVVLGTATPSFESLLNIERKRFERLALPVRAGNARAPTIRLIDLRAQPMEELFTKPLLDQIRQRLDADEQVLLFLNRRGYAPTLICHQCGWIAECRRCASRMTVHQKQNRLRCHHCAAERAIPLQCEHCGIGDLRAQGFGTERIELYLKERFPDAEIIRVDRDTTQRKNSLASIVQRAATGKRQILIGTQMLAKGHHFPNVTLVALLNTDSGLFGTDLRAAEHTAQLIMQVAGRAGREDKAGLVLIQTYHPEHPLLQQLITQGYEAFAKTALQERQQAQMPPYTHSVLIRAQSKQAQFAKSALIGIAEYLRRRTNNDIEILGPVISPMERKAGYHRMQLMLVCAQRPSLHQSLDELQEKLSDEKKAQWVIDVDPIDFS